MFIGINYPFKSFIYWTRRDIYVLLLVAIVPTACFQLLQWEWLAIPWVPVALVGTAASFSIGFKNTQTYNRLWEARQIWGGIVNTSRSFAVLVRDNVMVSNQEHAQIFNRHFAWLTALRYLLREKRNWETMGKPRNVEYSKLYDVPEKLVSETDALKPYLTEEDCNYVLQKKNKAAQLLAMQSRQLADLHQKGFIHSLLFTEMMVQLTALYEHQGRCERIKNFPYPRQFSSINLYLIWLMVILLPFGLLNEFKEMGEHFVWLNIPFSVIVSWAFTSMERVGEATENPFEGNANDVPISTLSISIERDLRDMLNDSNLPEIPEVQHNIVL
jgi:ion channel-forming bestrophin family protein